MTHVQKSVWGCGLVCLLESAAGFHLSITFLQANNDKLVTDLFRKNPLLFRGCLRWVWLLTKASPRWPFDRSYFFFRAFWTYLHQLWSIISRAGWSSFLWKSFLWCWWSVVFNSSNGFDASPRDSDLGDRCKLIHYSMSFHEFWDEVAEGGFMPIKKIMLVWSESIVHATPR